MDINTRGTAKGSVFIILPMTHFIFLITEHTTVFLSDYPSLLCPTLWVIGQCVERIDRETEQTDKSARYRHSSCYRPVLTQSLNVSDRC